MKDTTTMNGGISNWTRKTTAELKTTFDKLGIRHVPNSPSPQASREALLNKLSYSQGLVNTIGFKFPRHMVFVHKGVGKGTTAAQAGTTNRVAKEWFNPVIDSNIEELADIVAFHTGNMIVNNLEIR